jgi:hypothetical protein
LDIFNLGFWASGVWQSIGVIVTIATCVASPFLSMVVDRRFNKKEQDLTYINAYKAFFQREGSLSLSETIFFLPIQLAASYALYILGVRVLLTTQIDPAIWLDLSFIIVLFASWGLSVAKRKTLAKVLTWHFCFAMLVFSLALVGQKAGVPITKDFSFIKHTIGQYLPTDIKQFPLVASLRSISLKAIPVDIRIIHLTAARGLFFWVYGISLAFFLFGYTLYKRHHAQRATAFAYMSEKERRDAQELLEYKQKEAALDLTVLAKQEKEEDIALKHEQGNITLERDKLALIKEQLEVESARLDLEKKRAEYVLELAGLLADTLYNGGGTTEMRTELIRNALPALKEFGHKESTTIFLEHLQCSPEDTPRAIPAVTV